MWLRLTSFGIKAEQGIFAFKNSLRKLRTELCFEGVYAGNRRSYYKSNKQ